jgi:undecaprenyl diphosphate synthase
MRQAGMTDHAGDQNSTSDKGERDRAPLAGCPKHLAIIMDGNGRWAQQRSQPRMVGHLQGAEVVRTVTTECAKLGIEALTLYSFSMENWKRPAEEVQFLMRLCVDRLRSERQMMLDNNIRFRQVGRREGLPNEVLDELDRATEATAKNTGMVLALALNYGSRTEITDAMKRIARAVQAGELSPEAIDEQTISTHLYTAGLPDPDLLIRTAGEMRVSNFLLWQISYAELWVTQTLWPDFTVEDLHEALTDFAGRQRRFGAVLPGQTG